MRFQKAVITAAGPDQRALPLQTLVDRDGREKSVLGILIEQALAAKVEEICVVVWPGDENRYIQAAAATPAWSASSRNPGRSGYGHAIYCAHDFVGSDPFLHMVGDHIYVSAGKPSAAQVVEIAQAEECSVSGVQATRESLLAQFGAVAGRRLAGRHGLYRVDTVIEKPTPTEAEQRLVVSGIRAGYYLCFFGIHALTPTAMELLGSAVAAAPASPVSFSGVLAELAHREQYLAVEDNGPALQPGCALRPAHFATGAGAERPRPRGSAGAPVGIAGGPRTGGGIANSEPPHCRHHGGRPANPRPLARRGLPGIAARRAAGGVPALDRFRRASDNLYQRVRALFFLYAIHRFHIPVARPAAAPAHIPFSGYTNLLKRRFEEAIDIFLAAQSAEGPGAAISSALAAAYRGLGFQTLAGQVRHSVRSVRGNQWMFRIGHPADYPLRLRPTAAARRRTVPAAARIDARPHGPHS